MKHILGIGEFAISEAKDDELVTYALGSCVAILMYCPRRGVAAMAHIALPEPLMHMKAEGHKSAYFATEVVPRMLDIFTFRYQCQLENLHVHLIGGAESRSQKDPFQVGRRNVKMIKSLLDQRNIPYIASDVGGHLSRTVSFCIGEGALEIKTQMMMI